MVTTIRPKDETAATVVAVGDIFLIDGTTGVRGLAASSVLVKDANGNVAVNNVQRGYATTATTTGTTTLTVTSAAEQFFTGATTQTVLLPVTSTLVLGHTFYFQNNSTGNVTIQSSGANTVAVLAPGGFAKINCIAITGTTAASWQTSTGVKSLVGTDAAGSGYRFYRANGVDYTEIYKASGGLGGTQDPLNFYSSNISAVGMSLGRDGSLVTANGIMALGTSANALVIGPNGATNPAFNVDASTASSATGLSIKSAAAAGGVALTVTSSGTNESLVVNAKGSGGITIGNISTGGVNIVRPLTLGIAGSVVGSLVFGNATSGTMTIQPATGALGSGVATLAAGTYNLVGDTLAATFTNKIFDTAATGNSLLVGSIVVSRGQYPGTATNDNATAGNVGEYSESIVVSGSAVALVSGTGKDVTTLTLGAGDWDITGAIYYAFPASTSCTITGGSISTTANTFDTTPARSVFHLFSAVVPGAGINLSEVLPVARFSLSGSTTFHLVAQAFFTVSTLSAFGIIRARRVR